MNPIRLPLLLFMVFMAFSTPAWASEFVISIIDSATRQPVAARVYVENVETGKRHFVRAHSTTDGVIYERQNWANKNSIEVRLSNNNGLTWNTPATLYTTGPGDMGYPSTAQRPDGKLVTVFYAQRSPLRDGYHMSAIGWTAPLSVEK